MHQGGFESCLPVTGAMSAGNWAALGPLGSVEVEGWYDGEDVCQGRTM